jgi:hypothetical protein
MGAEVAFRIRNDRDSWLGEKTVKVASAALVSATIDLLLGTDSKSHPMTHAAVSLVEATIVDKIINGTMRH